MKITNIIILAGVLILLGFLCKNINKSSPHLTAFEKEWEKHNKPNDSIENIIKIGKTFALESSQVNGIERDEFNDPEYFKEIDTIFFQKIETKDFSDPQEDGGSTYSLEIYKAVKKGNTEIKFYRKEKIKNNDSDDNNDLELPDHNIRDTTILYNTYKFRIE